MNVRIPIKLLYPSSQLPEPAADGDWAFDLFACLNRNESVRTGERRIIPCGFAVEMPEFFGLFIVPKSGLSVRHGITVHNAPGLIDSNYRGEVRVVVHNDRHETFQVFPGARIAQAVVLPIARVQWAQTDTIKANDREAEYV